MSINRIAQKLVEKYIFGNGSNRKLIVIYGARRVGKTTLVKEILKKNAQNSAYYSCDFPDTREVFAYKNVKNISKLVKNLKLLVIDEAQRVENIGLVLKILFDEYPDLQVIATGSSSFDLANKINEPLTGRKVEIKLYPLALTEVLDTQNMLEIQRKFEEIMRFGLYPNAYLSNETESKFFLKELTQSYLYKDIFEFQQLKRPEILDQLVQLLAFQIGQEISYHELATQLRVDQTVIQRYISLLESAFIVFRLGSYSTNLRKEVIRSKKIYFWDLGVRNMMVQNFNNMQTRTDVGQLWENFCVVERLKKLEYTQSFSKQYFWRQYNGGEVDYLEHEEQVLQGFEFKWGDKKLKIPAYFKENYPETKIELINPDNLFDWVKI